MKILFVRPPRKLWPYYNEQENILLPQALPCLSAVLRKESINVKILDCVPLKMGWKTLRKTIEKEHVNIICLSESETQWGHEGLKTAALVKKIDPSIKIIAGGGYFSFMAKEFLKKYPIDFIVRGEGEITLIELIKELQKRKSKQNFKKIKGIAFKQNKKIIITSPRPLINNLDSLPFPAYELMPMEFYRAKGRYSGLITIHHSRGCNQGCNFCICWVKMADCKSINGKEVYTPRWRTKSVENSINEIEWLIKNYKCQNLSFTDDTWNLNPQWNKKFAEEMIERKIKLRWSAFMRADHIVRDEKLGIFKKLVKSGLSHVIIGVERSFDEDLKYFNKTYSNRIIQKAFKILNNYDSVFSQATFIVGLKNETKKSMFNQLEYSKKLKANLSSFLAFTPTPGTPMWEEAKKNNWLELKDLRSHDWINPVMSSETLNREELRELIYYLTKKRYFNDALKNLAFSKGYKRRQYLYFLKIKYQMLKETIREAIRLPLYKMDKYSHLVEPRWYNK